MDGWGDGRLGDLSSWAGRKTPFPGNGSGGGAVCGGRREPLAGAAVSPRRQAGHAAQALRGAPFIGELGFFFLGRDRWCLLCPGRSSWSVGGTVQEPALACWFWVPETWGADGGLGLDSPIESLGLDQRCSLRLAGE